MKLFLLFSAILFMLVADIKLLTHILELVNYFPFLGLVLGLILITANILIILLLIKIYSYENL